VVKKVDPVRGTWRIDLHTHTWVSPDSKTDPKALVEQAREVGLNRIAVTDHNVIEGALEAHRLAPDLVIVGEEIETETGGELIAYFVQEVVPPHLPIGETIRRLREQGAVISISHPVDTLRNSALGEKLTLEFIEQVDALEVFNARCLRAKDNAHAAEIARRYGKAITAGSDAHTLREIGRGYLTLPPFRDAPQAFLDSLNKATPGGRLSGIWPHFASTFAKLGK
jgi:predicted metal-dependent phosphoesterase TrpH